MRPEVSALVRLGRLPDEDGKPKDDIVRELDLIREQSRLLEVIGVRAPSVDEVSSLCRLFPADGGMAFGLAWTLLHIIESSESWPEWDVLEAVQRDWRETLTIRLKNAGIISPSDGRGLTVA